MMALSRIETLIRQLQGRAAKTSGDHVATWPGGAALSNIMTVAHGRGEVPDRVQVLSQDQAGVGANAAYVIGVDATNISYRVTTIGGFAPLVSATTQIAWWTY